MTSLSESGLLSRIEHMFDTDNCIEQGDFTSYSCLCIERVCNKFLYYIPINVFQLIHKKFWSKIQPLGSVTVRTM